MLKLKKYLPEQGIRYHADKFIIRLKTNPRIENKAGIPFLLNQIID